MAKVTIGIPVYNEIRFIENTLRSVIGQADEIIISDNASTDGTSDICRLFAEKYPEIRYFRHEVNQGVVVNFLYCMTRASGDYFMWVGGHDCIPKNHVLKLKKMLDADHDVVLAYSNAASLNSDYAVVSYYAYDYADELMSDEIAVRISAIAWKLRNCTVFHGLYRREVLLEAVKRHDRHMPFEHIFFSDLLLLMEVAALGKMSLVKDSVYYRMIPREPSGDIESLWLRIVKVFHPDKDISLLNAYEFPLGTIVGQYALALDLYKSSSIPSDLPKRIKDWAVSHRWGIDKKISIANLDIKKDSKVLVDEIVSEINRTPFVVLGCIGIAWLRKIIRWLLPYGVVMFYYKHCCRKNCP